MQIHLNGDPRDLPVGTTITGLLQILNLTPDKVAVEVNRRLVRGSKYDTILQDADQVEVVTFVGGG